MSIILENNCIKELLKEEESQKRNTDPICQYIKTLKLFLYLLKNQSATNLENTVQELSKIIKLKKICKNELIYQQGETGENFFIILNGRIKILTLRPYEYYMSEEEYILFLLQSRLYNQKDIIHQCYHFNSLVYPVPYDNFDTFVKELSIKKTKAGIYLDCTKAVQKAIEVDEVISKEKENKNKKIISPEEYIKKNKVSDEIIYNTKLINNFINNNNIEENREEDTKKIKLMMKDRKKIIIPEYEIFYELETGGFFGEFALETSGCTQEFTMISVQDESHLGYISKNDYYSLIHNSVDKRNTTIFNIILYFSLYRPINQALFEKKYLHFFRDRVFDINNIIFNEGDEWNEMYFITDGEYELSVNKNIIEVNQMIVKYKEILKKINNKNNKISNSYLNIDEEIKQNNSLILNQKFNTKAANKLMLDKKNIKLNILYARDIIGLSDIFLYNNENENYSKDNDNTNYNKPTVIYGEQIQKKCLVTCKCLTYNCHTYSLNNIIFNNLYYNEGNYNQSTKNLEIKKICSMIERLQKHKKYIFDLINKEQNKFSKKLKKLKFFTKNPKIHQKGKLEPSLYQNILTNIKLSIDSKDKNYNNKILKKSTNRNIDNNKIFNRHTKTKDKFDFSKQYFPTISKNKKSNIINKYSLNLKILKKQKENEKDRNETIYTIYNKNTNDIAQNNLSKLLIRDFLYEKYFYNYTFSDLNDNNYDSSNSNKNNNFKYNSHTNMIKDKLLNENINKTNTNIKYETNYQKNILKSFSSNKIRQIINIKQNTNLAQNSNTKKSNSLCQTNFDFDNKPEIFKSNFSIDGKILEKSYQNKIMNTVSKMGNNKIRLMKIKPNKVYDPLAFDKFNNYFNINFRKQYIISDNNQ